MASPSLLPQGTLNRLRTSLILPSFPTLNITAPFLGKDSISISYDGKSTIYLPTLTGAVTSQEPYLMFTMVAHLVRTLPLANAYKVQMETNAALGDGTLRTDTASLSPYGLSNLSIMDVREIKAAGDDPVLAYEIGGYYIINQNLFQF
jgi:hypothetical protein